MAVHEYALREPIRYLLRTIKTVRYRKIDLMLLARVASAMEAARERGNGTLTDEEKGLIIIPLVTDLSAKAAGRLSIDDATEIIRGLDRAIEASPRGKAARAQAREANVCRR